MRALHANLGPEDVLTFWKSKKYEYPILSAMAKDYLTVQASSTTVGNSHGSYLPSD
jgi:hypothetical protein